MPPNPPAILFWSITAYDAETAAGVDADGQEYPLLNGTNDLDINADGSITISVGPRAAGRRKELAEDRPRPRAVWPVPLLRAQAGEYKVGNFVKTSG